MGFASAGEPVTAQSKGVMSAGMGVARQLRCSWQHAPRDNCLSQKLAVPLLASQNHPQMHLDPVQGGMRAGMSKLVDRC